MDLIRLQSTLYMSDGGKDVSLYRTFYLWQSVGKFDSSQIQIQKLNLKSNRNWNAIIITTKVQIQKQILANNKEQIVSWIVWQQPNTNTKTNADKNHIEKSTEIQIRLLSLQLHKIKKKWIKKKNSQSPAVSWKVWHQSNTSKRALLRGILCVHLLSSGENWMVKYQNSYKKGNFDSQIFLQNTVS